MKKYKIAFVALIPVFVVFFLLQCSRNEENLNVTISSIEEAPISLRNNEVDIGSVDAYIVMQSYGVGNSGQCGRTGFDIYAVFEDGLEAGSIVANGKEALPNSRVGGGTRYNYWGQDHNELNEVVASNSIACQFSSSIEEEYASLSTDMIFPSDLCSDSSIPFITGNLSKSTDLNITWQPDPNIETVHISICATGSPCIFKEVSDTGGHTISSNQFADFEIGAHVFIVIGRGYAKVVEQSNGKKLGLVTVSYEKFPNGDLLVVE